MKLTMEVKLTPAQLAEAFCDMSDEEQAQVFVEAAKIASTWEPVARHLYAGSRARVARAALSLAPPPAQASDAVASREGAKDGTCGMAELRPATGRGAQEPVTSAPRDALMSWLDCDDCRMRSKSGAKPPRCREHAPQSSGDNEAPRDWDQHPDERCNETAPPPSGDTSIPDAKDAVPGHAQSDLGVRAGVSGAGSGGGAAPNPPTSSPYDTSLSCSACVAERELARPGTMYIVERRLHSCARNPPPASAGDNDNRGPGGADGSAINGNADDVSADSSASAEEPSPSRHAYVAALERVAEVLGSHMQNDGHHWDCSAFDRQCNAGGACQPICVTTKAALAALRTAREEARHV